MLISRYWVLKYLMLGYLYAHLLLLGFEIPDVGNLYAHILLLSFEIPDVGIFIYSLTWL